MNTTHLPREITGQPERSLVPAGRIPQGSPRELGLALSMPAGLPHEITDRPERSLVARRVAPSESSRPPAGVIPRRKPSQNASALVVGLFTCLIVSAILSSYLSLINHRNHSAMRAMAWNAAIPVLEAGIEEALTHLHEDQNNLAVNSWNADSVNGLMVYSKQSNPWPDGSYYSVTIANAPSAPVITSTGYVKAPLKENAYVTRVVQVTTTNPPSLFSRAIAANGAVRLSGGAVVDGYDSTLGPYGGTNRNASGGIATNSKDLKAIDVGSAHLYGTAVTGPGGTVAVNGGSVGDLDWAGGIQEGWVTDDMNVQFQPNSPPDPAPTFQTVTPTSVNGSNITYLTSGTYRSSDFISNDKTRPMVITGNATLWVSGDFVVLGTGYVYIAPGASLNLYVSGTASISGGGVINGTGLPTNFSYYGLPSNKIMNYSGSANFVGTINAPQAAFTISGGTSVYGAVICNTFTSSGGSGVHYDQGTSSKGIMVVTAWREL